MATPSRKEHMALNEKQINQYASQLPADARYDDKRMLTLLIVEILQRFTDEDHHLTSEDITNIIITKFNKEHSASTKKVTLSSNTVSSHIRSIQKSKCLNIMVHKNDGWYCTSKIIDASKLQYLINMVQASQTLSEEETEDIEDFLAAQVSIHKAENIVNQIVVVKPKRKATLPPYTTIDIVNQAWGQRKLIRFTYNYTYKDGEYVRLQNDEPATYIEMPLFVAFHNDVYHLYTYRDDGGCCLGLMDNNIHLRRLDLIENLELTDIDAYASNDILDIRRRLINVSNELFIPSRYRQSA